MRLPQQLAEIAAGDPLAAEVVDAAVQPGIAGEIVAAVGAVLGPQIADEDVFRGEGAQQLPAGIALPALEEPDRAVGHPAHLPVAAPGVGRHIHAGRRCPLHGRDRRRNSGRPRRTAPAGYRKNRRRCRRKPDLRAGGWRGGENRTTAPDPADGIRDDAPRSRAAPCPRSRAGRGRRRRRGDRR